jgi:galactonate dehydratase
VIILKIIDVKCLIIGNPWKNWVFVELFTDEGLVGLGECTGGLSTMPHYSFVLELKSRILGKDPTRIPALLDFVRKTLFLDRGGNALSGIEMACWDIVGKANSMPLYKMLGGKYREKIRVYANGWYQGERIPESFAARAKEMVDKGYTALKFDPFGKAYKFMSRKEELFSAEIVSAVRNAVGEDIDLMIECHDRFTLTEAIRIAGLLEPYHPFWFETPVLSENHELVSEVARRVRIPVIAGEREKDPRQISHLLSLGAIDMVNPEIIGVGGVSGLLDCFSIARGFDAHVAPHNAQSPYCTAVNVHVGITQSNLLIQECFDESISTGLDSVLSGYPKVENGFIEPTDAPGIGVSINEEAAENFKYGDKNFLWMFEDEWEKRRGAK